MKNPFASLQPVRTARALVAAEMVALLFSPPISNLFEFTLFGLLLGSAEVRAHLKRTAREPVVLATLAFIAVLTVGVFYSIAPWERALGMYTGWRKILLLPIAIALFDEPAAKIRLVWVFIAAVSLCMLASYAAWAFGFAYAVHEPGVIVRNHATQGMFFSAAAFAAAALLLSGSVTSGREQTFLGALVALLLANVIFITPGRSGYVVLLMLGAALAIGAMARARASLAKTLAASAGALLLGVALLWLSPTVRQRMSLAFEEVQTYQQATQVTSAGMRVFMLQNAVEMIAKRPLLGYGTGAFGAAYAKQIAGKPGIEGAIVTSDPHNQYLNIAGENGLLGLLAFLAVIGAACRQPVTPAFRLLGLGVLAAWCASSLASSHFGTFSEGRFVFLWIGAMLAPLREASAASDARPA